MEGSGRGLIEVLSRHFLGRIEEKHETFKAAGVLTKVRIEYLPNTGTCSMALCVVFYEILFKLYHLGSQM
jgi:hypothetical protein